MASILYIGQNPGAGTGSPVIVLRHLRRFAQDGWRVSVLADYGGDYSAVESAGWTLHRLCHRRWWWPPYRDRSPGLRWMRLRLLAGEVANITPKPDVILGYLAAHTDFSADLATHVARAMDVPLHMLVHDDATAFPAARGRQRAIRRYHNSILTAANVSWFVSPELADCFALSDHRRRVLLPIPEGWAQPAKWQQSFATKPKLYYAGHVWPEQLPLMAKLARSARSAGYELVVLSRPSTALRSLAAAEPIQIQAPFATNEEALAHLASHASALLVSYAETVAAMPWCATSFPSKLVEYSHLGIPTAIVAPAESSVGRWAVRTKYPFFFAPADTTRFEGWLTWLRGRSLWEDAAAVSLRLARTEFDPVRIHSQLANAIPVGTESRAA
jgi:hypothetical protein